MRNPLIVSSSGLTDSVEKIQKLEKAGAGAVVLKSLFEEQILFEAGHLAESSDYPEADDYIQNYTRSNSVDNYLDLIEQASSQYRFLSLPVSIVSLLRNGQISHQKLKRPVPLRWN